MKNITGKDREANQPGKEIRFGELLTEPDTELAFIVFPDGFPDKCPVIPFNDPGWVDGKYEIDVVVDTTLMNYMYMFFDHDLKDAVESSIDVRVKFDQHSRMVYPEFKKTVLHPVVLGDYEADENYTVEAHLGGERITKITLEQITPGVVSGSIKMLALVLQRWRKWPLPIDIKNWDEMPQPGP